MFNSTEIAKPQFYVNRLGYCFQSSADLILDQSKLSDCSVYDNIDDMAEGIANQLSVHLDEVCMEPFSIHADHYFDDRGCKCEFTRDVSAEQYVSDFEM